MIDSGILEEIGFSDPEVAWTVIHCPHVVIPKGNPYLRTDGTMNAWRWQKWCVENLPARDGHESPVWVHQIWGEDGFADTLTLRDFWNCILPHHNTKSVEFRFSRSEHATLFKLYHG